MANIHSALLTFTHSLVTTLGYRSIPAWHPAPARSLLHSVPRGPLLPGGLIPFFALTTSCASPKASVQLSLFARWAVFAAWTIRCWSLGPSRRYLTRTFSWMLGPLPRLSQWCLYPFLPTERRPSRNGYAVGSLAKSIQRLLYGPYFRGCSHFFMFRPPSLLATRVVPTAGAFAFRAAVTFYFRAPCVSLPSRTSDMLAVRIGQLTAGDLHPIRFATLSAASNR
jgi:hypothetical protein